MKRFLIVMFLAIFCISNLSYAEEASQDEISKTRGGFLLLLLPALVSAGKTFLHNFIDKTAEKVVSKVSGAPGNKKSGGSEDSSSSNEGSGDSNANDNSASPATAPEKASTPPEDRKDDQSAESSSGGKVNLALLVKVWLVKGNNAIAVDPEKTVFKLGDIIYLEVAATSPGVVEAYNITPNGKVQKIGSWTVNSVGSVRIPNEARDYIEFYEDTGEDTLQVKFYPCLTASGKRSLRIKNTSGLVPEVASQLPVCGSQNTGTNPDVPQNTRSLRVKQGEVNNTGYTMNTYDLKELSSVEPIVYTLKLRSR
ncbi:MAG: hypothetical protein HQL09_10680 [Nitrospirae bacterium]|nr:hypothetical protein [Nitrospirota bacterium]